MAFYSDGEDTRCLFRYESDRPCIQRAHFRVMDMGGNWGLICATHLPAAIRLVQEHSRVPVTVMARNEDGTWPE